jgi:Holliday junction resolvase-like predicted endonuclease
MRLAEEAAERGNAWPAYMELLDARLRTAPSGDEAKTLARRAARVAKDKLADLDRAAALLYQAHQADADDVDVRFELTEIYAQIPRLAAHAVTGVLQLLRRIPSDERVFRLAADLAESQQQLERARALRRIEDVLGGRGIPTDVTKRGMLDERPPVRPLDAEAIASRMAPTGWGGPLQQLLTLCGSAIELALYGDGVVPPDAKPLHEARRAARSRSIAWSGCCPVARFARSPRRWTA